MTNRKPTTAAPKTNHICLLVDRSLSTQGIAPGIIRQFNQQAEQINRQSRESGQSTHLSLYTFSSQADRPLLFEVPLGLVNLLPITDQTYRIEGNTAMLDSVGMAIDDLSQFHRGLNRNDDHSFLIIVLTDGEENNSVNYGIRNNGVNRLASLMQEKSRTDAWSFAFMVPVGNKNRLVRDFRIPEGNVLEWDTHSSNGVEDYGRAASAGLTRYFQDRSSGKRAVTSFFAVTDLSNITAKRVAAQLTEVTKQFSKFLVRPMWNKREIKEFCEAEVCNVYTKGNAYYELTKPEIVQPSKEIIVEYIISGKLYSGNGARGLLKLPDTGGDIKVKPGDHGNFRIYVESTSVNRHLVAGTSVLYARTGITRGARA